MRLISLAPPMRLTAVAELDSLITNVSAGRAKYGAYINRLEHASDNLRNVAQNTDASRGQIEDADYAAETSELARTQNNLASVNGDAGASKSD